MNFKYRPFFNQMQASPGDGCRKENQMPKFSANLTLLFTEVDFPDRFEKAAKAGFKAVEYMFPYSWPAAELAEKLEENGLKQVLYNLPAGDWEAGERGIACLPGREQEFREGVLLALEYAKALRCPALNCLAGLTPPNLPREQVMETLKNNLEFAARTLEKEGVKLMVEALNSKDIPGFHLVGSKDVIDLIHEVGHSNLFFQYDIYHMQRMEGDLVNTLRALMDRIGHIQLADNPGRHEPGTGEIHFANLFRAIDEAGYPGWIGCEYNPAAGTEAGLGWLDSYR